MAVKIAVVGVPGKASTDDLAAALERRGAEVMTCSLEDARLDMNQQALWCGGVRLDELDAVAVKKLGDNVDPRTPLRTNLLYFLESRGVRVFSHAAAIDLVNERYRMTMTLAEQRVPIPATVITDSLEEAATTIEEWGGAVLKPVFTSKGRGMHLVHANEAYRLVLHEWEREGLGPYYLQAIVPHAGRDLGVAVLGGRVLGAYYRVGAPGEWRTSVQLGGHYERAPLTNEIRDLAIRVADIFGLDFTVVDVVETADGPLVYEASAFGGFGGLMQSWGVDAASEYAGLILDRVGKRP